MLEYFVAPEYGTFWSAFGAIAQGIASVLGLVALIYSIKSFREAIKASHYAELDRIYSELLTKALDKPYLRNPQSITDAGQMQEYDTYAFMVWNFLETIVDRCDADNDLCDTWYPIIDAENTIHRDWFDRQEHRGKFKKPFHDFIRSGVYRINLEESQPAAAD